MQKRWVARSEVRRYPQIILKKIHSDRDNCIKNARSSFARGGCWRDKRKWCDVGASRTVDGNGDALGQSETILANKGGDLAKAVGSEVLGGSVANLGLNDVELEVVGLRDGLDGGGAGVALNTRNRSVTARQASGDELIYLAGVERSERHLGRLLGWQREQVVRR